MGDYYGAKCHRCACIRHDDRPAPVISWLPKPPDVLMWCADCESCQDNALTALILHHGMDLFGPETRAAVKAFKAGEPHPTIDTLREECQAIDADLAHDNGR